MKGNKKKYERFSNCNRLFVKTEFDLIVLEALGSPLA